MTLPASRYAVWAMLICRLWCAPETAHTAQASGTEEVLTLDALHDFLADQFELEIEPETRRELEQFWHDIQRHLASNDLEELAAFHDTVLTVTTLIVHDPQWQPWVDWLRQRTDYFVTAAWIVQEVPMSPPSRAAPATSAPPVKVPVPAKPTPGKALATRQRRALTRKMEVWERQLAQRPPPPKAARWAPRLKQIFRQAGLPPELVWVAEAESSFNPAARSPAGALGLFQLMPATAQRFGLRTGTLRDDRRDPERNARAASRYLALLYHEFGSWPLALAAYNAGEGRLRRAMQRAHAATFEEVADSLPVETQMYVPKVRALVRLREGRLLDSLPAPRTTARAKQRALSSVEDSVRLSKNLELGQVL